MKRIALALLTVGALALAPASAPADDLLANPPAAVFSTPAADQAVIVPVDRYVYRGWYAPRYYRSYYYDPYWGSYYGPRSYYYSPGPYVYPGE